MISNAQVFSSTIQWNKIPEAHGASKSLDLNIWPEKRVSKPLIKEILQVKPQIGQGRAGSRWKKPQINQPIAQ